MKLTSRKVPTFGEQRRAGRQNDRLQAPTLRSRYATIGKLQIDLTFRRNQSPGALTAVAQLLSRRRARSFASPAPARSATASST